MCGHIELCPEPTQIPPTCLQADSLEVVGVSGRHLPLPIVAEPQHLELRPKPVDVLLCCDCRVCPGLGGGKGSPAGGERRWRDSC